jgi:hypothetical protein
MEEIFNERPMRLVNTWGDDQARGAAIQPLPQNMQHVALSRSPLANNNHCTRVRKVTLLLQGTRAKSLENSLNWLQDLPVNRWDVDTGALTV